MARTSLTTDAIGFVMGFFLGCCGIALALTLFRDYLRGAVMGLTANIVLGIVVGVVADAPTSIPVIRLDGAPMGADVPWDLVAAFGIGTVTLFGLTAAAIWVFGGSDDDDRHDPEPPAHSYVTFDR